MGKLDGIFPEGSYNSQKETVRPKLCHRTTRNLRSIFRCDTSHQIPIMKKPTASMQLSEIMACAKGDDSMAKHFQFDS